MIIRKMILENFGPYYGEHSIIFATHHDSPITLVHGENMRGKTTLLSAIRWCLYGELIESESAYSTYELLNYDARDEENFYFSVKLLFRHQDYDYELERQVQAPSKPSDDSHLRTTVYLKRGGQFLPSDQVIEVVNNILPKDVSRFFLFDGEMLQQYEALVRDTDLKTELVKNSIERILGLPALRLAIEDIEDLRKKAAKKQREAVKNQKESRELLAEAEALENEIEGVRKNLSELRVQEGELEGRRQRLRDQRKQYAAVREEALRLESIENKIENMKGEQQELTDESKALLEEAWWQPIVPLVKKLQEHLLKESQAETHLRAKRATLKDIMEKLSVASRERTCPTCSQSISDEMHDKIQVELNSLTSQLEEVETKCRHLLEGLDSAGRLARLRKFQTARSLYSFKEKERRIQRLDVDIRNETRRVKELSDALKQYDLPEIRRIESDLEDTVGELKLLKAHIEEESNRLQGLQTRLAQKQNEIDRLPAADKAISAEANVYNVILKTFSGAIDRFREELRVQVEGEASKIFRSLTTETDYEGLKINKNYGMDIVDNEDRVISRRSKGAEQVVALSLIASLNKCAVREGPVVMDTPFGRLDEGHRKNIVQYLPDLAPQVVLLVQSGEWDSEDTKLLEDALGREYRIARDGKPTRSRIESAR